MRKGQIQTGELVMVVIVVMILLIIGIVVYGGFKAKNLEETGREIESLDAVDLAQEALSLQELSCSFSVESGECVDSMRLEALAGKIRESGPGSDVYNYYRSRFGTAMIMIESIFPVEESWQIYEFRPSGTSSELPVRIPLYVYDPINKTNSFGVIEVVKYS